jgi:hypothetical protein
VGFTERSIEVETEGGTASTRSSGRSGKAKADEPETASTAEQELPEMPVSQLIEGARTYLGYSSWTAAGALHGRDPDEMMSVETAKATIQRWRDQPATPPPDDSEE